MPDQADFSFYFDTGGRRRCYIAPERFYESGAGDAGQLAARPLRPEMVRGPLSAVWSPACMPWRGACKMGAAHLQRLGNRACCCSFHCECGHATAGCLLHGLRHSGALPGEPGALRPVKGEGRSVCCTAHSARKHGRSMLMS